MTYPPMASPASPTTMETPTAACIGTALSDLDIPASPLTDVPDDLSDWSEANVDEPAAQLSERELAGLDIENTLEQPTPASRTRRSTLSREKGNASSIPRRSHRDRRAPAKFCPPPPTPTHPPSSARSEFLLVKLPISPQMWTEMLARSLTQLPTPRTSTKRRSDSVDSSLNANERSTSRRHLTGSTPSRWNIHLQDVTKETTQPHIKDKLFVQSQPLDSQNCPLIDQSVALDRTILAERVSPSFPAHIAWTAPSPPETDKSESSISQSDNSFHLRELAQQLHEVRSTTPKPEPCDQPEVWADTRMELCETLHYYRSYHGGCYATGGFARAFMFADNAHPRDYMDASVIISRAGGGLAKDKETGAMTMGKDQTETPVVQSLRASMTQFNPVVLITANNNPFVPSQPPHPYCVMDYFKPANIWWEKSRGRKFIRFRFEKLNSKKTSWWAAKGASEIAVPGSLEPPVAKICSVCDMKSQQVYVQGWMCLEPQCTSFWKLHSPLGELSEPREESLMYDPRFLKQHTPWPNDDQVYPLASVDVELSGKSIAGEDCLRAHWSGIVCPQCGRCNSRLLWKGWKCATTDCTWEKKPTHVLIPAACLHDPFNPVSATYTPSRDLHLPTVKLSVSFAHNYRINRFEIPGVKGFITHMIANKTIIEESGGPNEMYEDLQKDDIGLARRPMGHDHFTRHYAVNYGMPYKFIAATASSAFTGSARPITATRSRLNWAAQCLLSAEAGETMHNTAQRWKPQEFNEVLALGYFENQKISYHDDGETGLGPTIATLSLGDTGTMRIRMKAKHYNGVSKAAGVYNTSYPLPGCMQYAKRCEIYDCLRQLESSDKKAWNQRLKEIPKELGLKSGGNAKDAIQMTLGHGDIVVMHGAELQKYYEHSVDHAGKLRFALTCRYIDPQSLKEEDKPTYEVAPDEEDYDGARLSVPGS